MSNQNLEMLVNTLSFQVAQQGQQIAELQKQLADMQKATSCELDALSARIVTVENFNR
ncbi:TPA: hypothetical protein U2M58_004040 [Providencia stuartii]|uniref:Uncharacterized protein n=1 Tax=Providencia stuartii TaxID=588 RepID=A0AAJ1N801_PROST|nr:MULTISPECIES: hypothetical protein [Providencia]ELR5044614.1 hypothetical protein [Providencia rettgeri]MBN5602925.1 hypothetical protein [Providencia stuartii]MBN5606971.1 hypothetical protein [Providencia stuartii]MDE5305528.1 hypothetical protein [Providencia stuartii]MDE5305698.1 hypothetical protein [Providencia stuartii]